MYQTIIVQKGSNEWERGIRGYIGEVVLCKKCLKQTNVIWEASSGRKYVACGLECAEMLDQ